MPDKAWKAFERRVAAYFGGQRNSLSGRNSKAGAGDVLHPILIIECKQRVRHTAVALWDATRDLDCARIPVVALSEKGRPGFWLLIHSDDLLAVAAAHRANCLVSSDFLRAEAHKARENLEAQKGGEQ